jgi:siroheme synthase-like protein
MTFAYPLYPVALDLAGRPVLVVGAGRVAARKLGSLVDCGAAVTVVAPEVDASIATRAAEVSRLVVHRRPYRRGEARSYRLVVCATGDPAVDGTVASDAEAAGVWVNSADDPSNCSFVLPSVHRDGAVSIAVATDGTAPAVAAWLRRRIGAMVGPGLGTLAALVAEARARAQAAGRATEALDWAGLLDGPLPGLVRRGDLDRARSLLEALVGVPGPP